MDWWRGRKGSKSSCLSINTYSLYYFIMLVNTHSYSIITMIHYSVQFQMLKAHSWANLNRPDMQQYRWDGTITHDSMVLTLYILSDYLSYRIDDDFYNLSCIWYRMDTDICLYCLYVNMVSLMSSICKEKVSADIIIIWI